MAKIVGSMLQLRLGRLVDYLVDYHIKGAVGAWSGSIVLLGLHRHHLRGGQLVGVTQDNIGIAVLDDAEHQIDALDIDALNAANGF